jgi:hypothetical protein
MTQAEEQASFLGLLWGQRKQMLGCTTWTNVFEIHVDSIIGSLREGGAGTSRATRERLWTWQVASDGRMTGRLQFGHVSAAVV